MHEQFQYIQWGWNCKASKREMFASLPLALDNLFILVHFQHAHFIPKVGVGKRGEYQFVHGDLPRQRPFGTTLRVTGPVPADSRQ